MAGTTQLIKSFSNIKGLDLRSSDLTRGEEFATGITNVDYRKTGALNKRKGFHGKSESIGGGGVSTYANINLTTGAITPELIVLDANLHKQETQTFTVTYSGSNSSRMSMFLDTTTDTFKFVITEISTEILSVDLGTAIDDTTLDFSFDETCQMTTRLLPNSV